MFDFAWVLGTDLLLFSAIVFNTYLDICWPLHYSIPINSLVCVSLATFAWLRAAQLLQSATVLL